MNSKEKQSGDQPQQSFRLTELARGGGCGCKIEPGLLHRLIKQSNIKISDDNLIVDNQHADDAAVYKMTDEMAVMATTDFFAPIVDDPKHFGQIAATNALSDIYAMGGEPIFALAMLAMPLDKIDESIIANILAGGADACSAANIAIAGGHSIDAAEPIYGLSVIGRISQNDVRTNAMGKPGDKIILGKPLGIGVLSAAFKQGKLNAEGYEAMISITTRLNSVGFELAKFTAVRAMTDVTGFGLIGHLLEICKASRCSASINFHDLPLIRSAVMLAEKGVAAGATRRNWNNQKDFVSIEESLEESKKMLLSDPQTSGGLLVTCASESAHDIVKIFHDQGFPEASIIGELSEGDPSIQVSA